MDFRPTAEQLHWQGVARDFARRAVAPVARERERMLNARERYPWDLIRQSDEVGLRTGALLAGERVGGWMG